MKKPFGLHHHLIEFWNFLLKGESYTKMYLIPNLTLTVEDAKNRISWENFANIAEEMSWNEQKSWKQTHLETFHWLNSKRNNKTIKESWNDCSCVAFASIGNDTGCEIWRKENRPREYSKVRPRKIYFLQTNKGNT